ncbi:hypothetical protein LGV61_05390 [Desulfurispirillum indicum]|uniref:hypothetical protein n=1 Tax=Desulfurispirillum indicum TaxID=936456 RepID=UPI001CF9EE02|nr:hypothetical protein [Desulfurispirillum indicum]UCZ57709.1 hypothetical protein LGV61_05390 [Desulfurispirillum indicum]
MTRKRQIFMGATLLAVMTLAGCGESTSTSSGDTGGSTPPPGNTPILDQKNPANLNYLRRDASNVLINAMDVVSTVDGRSIHGTTQAAPLDIYPDGESSFAFTWDVQTSLALLVFDLYLHTSNQQEILAYAQQANPGQSSLKDQATCHYDNNNQLTCSKPARPDAYAYTRSSDLTLAFQQYPITVPAYFEACTLGLGGYRCDTLKLGYIRFN